MNRTKTSRQAVVAVPRWRSAGTGCVIANRYLSRPIVIFCVFSSYYIREERLTIDLNTGNSLKNQFNRNLKLYLISYTFTGFLEMQITIFFEGK